MERLIRLAKATGLFLGLVGPAVALGPRAGEGCASGWVPTFGTSPGVDEPVNALVVHDDGNGAAVYAGVDDIGVVRREGDGWVRVGELPGDALALAVYDDGGGPALYAGGSLWDHGNVARWDGTSWQGLGGGTSDIVLALAAHDDGGGPALYVGGEFANVGGGTVLSAGIARWDGTSWSSVAGGTNRATQALAVFDDGTGPKLYAGGRFWSAGGVGADRVACWNGSAWSPLASGVNDDVWALTTFDDGSGPALYAGGDFSSAGGTAAERIARWNGTSWSALAGGGVAGGTLRALAALDAGGAPALYAAGEFTAAGGAAASRLARWDGAGWSAVGLELAGSASPSARALVVHDDGGGARLVVGGDFTSAGGVVASRIAAWDGTTWTRLGGLGLSGPVRALALWDDGAGPMLYAGGSFEIAGGLVVNHVARWDGATWTPLGSGLAGTPLGGATQVATLVVHDDGSGPALYAGGHFSLAGGVPANSVARWDGTSWSPLADGLTGSSSLNVRALEVADHGTGPFLYAGTAVGVVRWDGVGWTSTGNVLTRALRAFHDAGGPALFAGPSPDVLRYNGVTWATLAFSPASVLSFAVHDDGDGAKLYSGDLAGEIRRRVGSSWPLIGDTTPPSAVVHALGAHDDGSGAALYAGGSFTAVSGAPARNVARWEGGTAWSALGDGTDGAVLVLLSFDDGSGPALYVGGEFPGHASGAAPRDAFLARWSCSPAPFPAFCDASDGSHASCPCGNAGAPDAGCDLPQGTGGVRLEVLAQTTGANGATLRGTGFNPTGNAAAVVIRSTSLDPASPVVFGDGLRCVNSSPLVRLGAAPSVGGVSLHAIGHGASAGAGTFYYQLWFRSNPSTYCDPLAAFNLSSGRVLSW